MPSLAARILDLHAQKFSREEIIRRTGCKHHYLRSVLSRASAPDAQSRAKRMSGTAATKGSKRYTAKLKAKNARDQALRRGQSLADARAVCRATYRRFMCAASEPTGATR